MALFGIGAAPPIIGRGYLSRSAIMKLRERLLQTGKIGKAFLRSAMLVVAILILSGLDLSVETWAEDRYPASLTSLTTRF